VPEQTRSGGVQRAFGVPSYGVIEAVVSPKQFTANNKGGGTKDVQPSRLARVVIIGTSDRLRVCCFDDTTGVLTNLQQTFREIGFCA